LKFETAVRRLFELLRCATGMAIVRYGIAGQPVGHSLSPLLTALVAAHLGLPVSEKQLKMELVEVSTLTDALAWGYAGAIPTPAPWAYTGSVFGKFRTSALLKKAVEGAMEELVPHPSLLATSPVSPPVDLSFEGLPTRMFDEEIWMNLTSPLKHQLDSSAVVCIDDSMATKSVNTLRWDGRGWWCAGLDGEGVIAVFRHHGIEPEHHVLGLCGGGGGARSTASAWVKAGGELHLLPSRRTLEDGDWSSSIGQAAPHAVVDFDGTQNPPSDGPLFLRASYEPMEGDFNARLKRCCEPCLDGRWLLVAQHLACWQRLWAPERAADLPSLDLLMTRLLRAEAVLDAYAS
jgi:hypothetical protein